MTITDKYEFETISLGTQGWNAMLTTFIEKVEAYLHTRMTGTLGEAVSAYDAVYQNPTDGKYYQAVADGVKWPCIALAVEEGVLDDEIRLHRAGVIENVAWALTAGRPVYLSDATAGAIIQQRPLYIKRQILGMANSATSIIFAPELAVADGVAMTTTTTTTTSSTTTTTTAP
jgi:hypothetical protein